MSNSSIADICKAVAAIKADAGVPASDMRQLYFLILDCERILAGYDGTNDQWSRLDPMLSLISMYSREAFGVQPIRIERIESGREKCCEDDQTWHVWLTNPEGKSRPFCFRGHSHPFVQRDGESTHYTGMKSAMWAATRHTLSQWFEHVGMVDHEVRTAKVISDVTSVIREYQERVQAEMESMAVPDGCYAPSDIAKAIGAEGSKEAIRKALKRLLDDNRLPDGAWMENADPAKGQARILYRLSAVRPLLERFKGG